MPRNPGTAKQLALSGFVVLTFIAYSAQQRGEKSGIVIAPAAKPQASQSASPASGQASSQASPATSYKDGAYTGSVADAYYGNIQVQVTIRGGKITDVQFLQHPQDNENSIYINQQAMPLLKQEAITAQSSHVDIISGATDTSYAFTQSLSSALSKAE